MGAGFHSRRPKPILPAFSNFLSPHIRSWARPRRLGWLHTISNTLDVIDDILRLECFRDHAGTCVSIFSWQGYVKILIANLLKLTYRDAGDHPFIPEHLIRSLDQKQKPSIYLMHRVNSRNFYREFQSEYGVPVPRKMRTTLLSRSRIDGIAVYLWQIESVQNRKEFNAVLPTW